MASTLANSGVALFAISYDTVEILQSFARTHGITFPLLSDEGSRVIRALGLINARVQDDHAVYGIKPNSRHVDLPYPGVFVLDRDGVIAQKRFHESYRERDTGPGLVAQVLGIFAEPAARASAAAPAVEVRAWLDSPTYVWFQRLTLTIEVAVAPGFHVYARPVSDGLAPLAVSIDAVDGLEVGKVNWPPPRSFALPDLGEELWVHEGTVRGSLPLTFTAAPGAGEHVLGITVSYQACDEASCLLPASVRLELPVREMALVGRALPGAAPTT